MRHTDTLEREVWGNGRAGSGWGGAVGNNTPTFYN